MHTPPPAHGQDTTMTQVAARADYSLLEQLTPDPEASPTGDDHDPREVRSGHYVPVTPTPLPRPALIAYSPMLFEELGLDDELAQTEDFVRVFSGDMAAAPAPMRPHGWATGYALSIYGEEYTQQCPFGTGNGYGDGRALSILEGEFRGRRWEFQLKGAGRTPYCRGGDGRAVLRSSVREFLAQEHMHALGVPTTRSLSLIVSQSEGVQRPWYREGSRSFNPDRWLTDAAAISTRVAPSFLRVGQLELFARRARRQEHPRAAAELEQILVHAIEREYRQEVDASLPLGEQLVLFTQAFAERLAHLVSSWVRVGYCQGNFNGDNCAVGGFTLDYGPFGFMERFDPAYQPWTGGGRHFAFLNQPQAAAQNFQMFWQSVGTWSGLSDAQRDVLEVIRRGFGKRMEDKLADMWSAKLGLATPQPDLVERLLGLMQQTPVDYTILFRALCSLPSGLETLQPSFYQATSVDESAWLAWLGDWHTALQLGEAGRTPAEVSAQMKAVNPRYILREWQLVPAYQEAAEGDMRRIHTLQAIMTQPYAEQDPLVQRQYDRRRPIQVFGLGGVSHMSCSS